jgi:hypothetical protein
LDPYSFDTDPDPDSEYGSGSGSTDLIESGSNTDPNPNPKLLNQMWSGFSMVKTEVEPWKLLQTELVEEEEDPFLERWSLLLLKSLSKFFNDNKIKE